MESTKCVDCAKTLSSKASYCPHCGAPRIDSDIDDSSTKKLGKKSNVATLVKEHTVFRIMIVIGLILIFPLLFYVGSEMRRQQDESWRESQNRIGWITGNIEPQRLTCGELLEEISKRDFNNSVRESIRLLSYQDIYPVSQSDDHLECMAQALFTTGSEGRFIFFVETREGNQNIGFRRP